MVDLVLVDTNVIVAALAEAHEHHLPSAALFDAGRVSAIAVAAHCFAEAFTTLTRRGGGASFGKPPGESWAALESVSATTRLVGLRLRRASKRFATPRFAEVSARGSTIS